MSKQSLGLMILLSLLLLSLMIYGCHAILVGLGVATIGDVAPPHDCACDSESTKTGMRRCGRDGASDPSGAYFCCNECPRVCSFEPQKPAKPPVPIPVPDCDHATHCRQSPCRIGDAGTCCKKCGQPCPPMSGEPPEMP